MKAIGVEAQNIENNVRKLYNANSPNKKALKLPSKKSVFSNYHFIIKAHPKY